MNEIIEYIRSDYFRYTGIKASTFHLVLQGIMAKNHRFAYSFWMRLASRKNVFHFIAKLMHYRLSRKYGIQISPKCKIGYGFYIGHGVGIIINSKTFIGNNCNVSQFLSIGSNKDTPAVIGNDVYIGPNVCIVENVHIGDNAIIGAGSIVVRDVPNDSTVVGNPAKVIGPNKHPEFIHNKFYIREA